MWLVWVFKYSSSTFWSCLPLQRNTLVVWGLKIMNCQTPGCRVLRLFSHSPGSLMGQSGFQPSLSPSTKFCKYCTSSLLYCMCIFTLHCTSPKSIIHQWPNAAKWHHFSSWSESLCLSEKMLFFVYVYGVLGLFSEARSRRVVLISTHRCLPTFGSGWQWAGRKQALLRYE